MSSHSKDPQEGFRILDQFHLLCKILFKNIMDVFFWGRFWPHQNLPQKKAVFLVSGAVHAEAFVILR